MDSPADTCVQRLEAARERYDKFDQRVRSVITWVDSSREKAAELDSMAKRGSSAGPLHGLLLGLKDNIDTAGVRTTSGAAFLSQNVPIDDAHCVKLAQERGALVVAKLNMAELAWGATTQNATYGACRNPWDLDRIPGGSSGGSGAALAARFCEASLGTDTGASVRVPASVNGVVGLRPTLGAISNRGIHPVAFTQDAVGPMAPLASDVARLTEALTEHDAFDPYSRSGLGLSATDRIGQSLRGIRVGLPDSFFFDDLDPDIACKIEDFVSWIGSAGAVVRPAADFGQDQAFEHWTRIVQCEGAAVHRDRLLSSPQDFSPDVFSRLEAGIHISATDLVRSLGWRVNYRHKLESIFDQYEVVVTPVVPIDVPLADGYDSRIQTRELGRVTYPWALHEGPTLSLPIGFHSQSGLPVGVAISAGCWNEAVLFQIAVAYQIETDWHQRLPELLGKD